MVETTPTSYRQLLAEREQTFYSALANGEIEPFVYPRDTLSVGILFLALLFLPRFHRQLGFGYSVWAARCAFGMIVYCCVSVMTRCRSLGIVSGYGIGLMSVWGITWAAVLLLYNDPKTTFRRVEVRLTKEVVSVEERRAEGKPVRHTNRSTAAVTSPVLGKGNTRVFGVFGGGYEPAATDEAEPQGATLTSANALIWQSYPDDLWHRVGWTADLCTSFRGPGWNWHIQTLPESRYPMEIMATAPASSKKLFTRIALRDFLAFYLLIDIVKAVVMADPYFWGVIPINSPALNITYLPELIVQSQFLIQSYRLLLSITAIACALCYIFSLGPLFFGVLLPLLGLDRYSRTPLQEPFLYPPYWGDFTTSVLDRGLAGWWGIWWHQMFRMGISEPSRVAIDKLGWNARSQKARMLQSVVAFSISGLLHTGASYTSFHPATRSLFAPFAFFLSQAFGIMVEQFVFKTMNISYVMQSWPRVMRRAGTLLYVFTWLYLTGPLLADDFAKSGVWMFEPVPFSLVRGLGFGVEGEGWWCWRGAWIGWWGGREETPWWKMGVVVL